MPSRQQRRAKARAPVRKRRKGTLAFIAIVTIILLAGGAAVALLRTNPPPVTRGAVAGVDHWHAIYEFQICGERIGPHPQSPGHEVHTHGHGQIHLHPQTQAYSGDNANLGAFLNDIETRIGTDDEGNRTLFMPNGSRYVDGEPSCPEDDTPYEVEVLNKGEPVESDPMDLILHDEDEIVIRYGPQPPAEASPIPFPISPQTMQRFQAELGQDPRPVPGGAEEPGGSEPADGGSTTGEDTG